MVLLLLSQGIPMLNAGDEVLRTQRGNNNTWCQDNELGWFDWNLLEVNREMLRFTRNVIVFRKRHPCLMHSRFLTGQEREGYWFPDITWHGARLNQPLWDDPDAQVLACTLGALEPWEEDLHIMMNMSNEDLHMPLPGIVGRDWYLAIDTSLQSPHDVTAASRQSPLDSSSYPVHAHSVVVFEAR
jgi:glycogen operon protein